MPGCRCTGFRGVLVSTLPVGAGLSSSAALELASAWALSRPGGPALAPLEVARIAQRAENEYVGMRCGLMDQFASACGVAGSAVMLDCRIAGAPDGAAARRSWSLVRRPHRACPGRWSRRPTTSGGPTASGPSPRCAGSEPAVRALRDVDLAHARARDRRSTRSRAMRARHIIEENDRVLADR